MALWQWNPETCDAGKNTETTPAEIFEPRAVVTASWPLEDQSLVDWFIELEAPTEPFYLEPHRHIVDQAIFYSALRMDITAGPDGPRAKMGTLQCDLRKLKAYKN